FTAGWSNAAGGGDATGVALGDPLPNTAGSGVVWSLASGATIPTGVACAVTGTAPTQTLSCETEPSPSGTFTLPTGSMISLHVTSSTPNTTGAVSCGSYANTASFASGNDGSDSKSATETVQCPTIDFTKTADVGGVAGSTANAGDTIGYTITAANTGAGLAHGVHITDNLAPSGLSWTLDTANTTATGCVVDNTAHTLDCAAQDVAAGASIKVHITAVPVSPTNCGPITDRAHFTTTNDGSGDSGTGVTTITVNCATFDFTKTADVGGIAGSTANAGDTIGYTITAHNTGAGLAHGVHITDNLAPSGLSWTLDTANTTATGCVVDNTAHTLDCAAQDVAAGASIKVHITAVPVSPTHRSSDPDRAHFTTTNDGSGDSGTGVTTITVNCATFDFTKTADVGGIAGSTANAGDTIGYTITAHNTG